MYVRMHDSAFVKAAVYPHAAPDADPRLLASSPAVTVLPDGEMTFNAKPVTVDSVGREAGEMILAIIEAEKISGKKVNRTVLTALALALVELTR